MKKKLNDLPNNECVAMSVIVGRPNKCRQLILKNAIMAVKLLANKSGSRVV